VRGRERRKTGAKQVAAPGRIDMASLSRAPALFDDGYNGILEAPSIPGPLGIQDRHGIPPAGSSPLHFLSIFSFLLTAGTIGLAALWGDGTAIIAIASVSLANSVISYTSFWSPLLFWRLSAGLARDEDVVIRTRTGAFVVIRCREEVARELYTAGEECQYVSTRHSKTLAALGLSFLMVALILLGNCTWRSKLLLCASYILLHGLYWIAALIPPKYFW
jgi:hypothetical protein